MIPYPDHKTRDAVQLYELLCRAAAIASIMDDDVLISVREWIIRHSGAEWFENQALLALIKGNLDVQDG